MHVKTCMQGVGAHTVTPVPRSPQSDVVCAITWNRDDDYPEGYSSIPKSAVCNFHSRVTQGFCTPSPAPSGVHEATPGAPGTGRVPSHHPNPEGIVPVTRELTPGLRSATGWERCRAVPTHTHTHTHRHSRGCSREHRRTGWQKGGQ